MESAERGGGGELQRNRTVYHNLSQKRRFKTPAGLRHLSILTILLRVAATVSGVAAFGAAVGVRVQQRIASETSCERHGPPRALARAGRQACSRRDRGGCAH